jgi:hypothetical protein
MGLHTCVAEKLPEAMKTAAYGRGRQRFEKD